MCGNELFNSHLATDAISGLNHALRNMNVTPSGYIGYANVAMMRFNYSRCHTRLIDARFGYSTETHKP